MQIDINLNDLYGTEAWDGLATTKAKYLFIGGAKGSGKSYAAAIWLLTKWLSNPNRNVLTLSATRKKHLDSTIPTMREIINRISEEYDMPMFAFDDEVVGGVFKEYDYASPFGLAIEYKPTGQKIIYKAADSDDVSSFKLRGKKGYKPFLDTILCEELVDVKSIGMEDEDKLGTWMDFLIKEDSIFRFRLDQEDEIHPQVLFSNNLWNPLDWIVQKLDELVPFNREAMETNGFEEIEDLEHYGGQGVYAMRSNYKIIEHLMTKQARTAKEAQVGEAGDVVILGKTAPFRNTMLADVIGQVERDIKAFSKTQLDFIPLSAGVDYARVKDAASLILLGTNVKEVATLEYGQAFQKLIFYDEYFNSNKDVDFYTRKKDIQVAMEMIYRLVEWSIEFPEIRARRFRVFVDYANLGFVTTLKEAKDLVSAKENIDLGWLVIVAKTQKFKKEARIGNRLELWRSFMELDMVIVTNDCPNLYNQLKTQRLNKQGKDTGKNDDARNASEYAWLPFVFRFMKVRDIKEIERRGL